MLLLLVIWSRWIRAYCVLNTYVTKHPYASFGLMCGALCANGNIASSQCDLCDMLFTWHTQLMWMGFQAHFNCTHPKPKVHINTLPVHCFSTYHYLAYLCPHNSISILCSVYTVLRKHSVKKKLSTIQLAFVARQWFHIELVCQSKVYVHRWSRFKLRAMLQSSLSFLLFFFFCFKLA